ncbi:LOW QUALITY PROTEIN: uncharacterized protein LOC143149621 [Ptiloglossa arizonensis]|uniref:LOW QUALITY PROTEIN: uncharacterized protein LOC143149621 n=1 Tax=Ptiloglossa arizonensis TaxID=3350558 RepID=UPI003F9FF5F6
MLFLATPILILMAPFTRKFMIRTPSETIRKCNSASNNEKVVMFSPPMHKLLQLCMRSPIEIVNEFLFRLWNLKFSRSFIVLDPVMFPMFEVLKINFKRFRPLKRSILRIKKSVTDSLGYDSCNSRPIDCRPYSDHVLIVKKECVGHVQKQTGARLRKIKKETKELGGKGKLTAKLIDELSAYYGLAIRSSKNSKEEMKKQIWTTLKHKRSTNENPQHEDCPPGPESWCSYQVAKASNDLQNYNHKSALHTDLLKTITPIYEELSSDQLLERCEGRFAQNQNESFNDTIWCLAPEN